MGKIFGINYGGAIVLTARKCLLILSILLVSTTSALSAEFDEKLSIFNNYLGTWEAVFAQQEGRPTMIDVASWEKTLNGKALRTLHSINDGMYGGESLIFYDKAKQSLVFYYFTTADFYTQGTIEIVDDNRFVAYEDVTGSQDGITKVKSTSRLLNDKMIVETSYLKNGEWTTPETRSYVRSIKTVKFK